MCVTDGRHMQSVFPISTFHSHDFRNSNSAIAIWKGQRRLTLFRALLDCSCSWIAVWTGSLIAPTNSTLHFFGNQRNAPNTSFFSHLAMIDFSSKGSSSSGSSPLSSGSVGESEIETSSNAKLYRRPSLTTVGKHFARSPLLEILSSTCLMSITELRGSEERVETASESERERCYHRRGLAEMHGKLICRGGERQRWDHSYPISQQNILWKSKIRKYVDSEFVIRSAEP